DGVAQGVGSVITAGGVLLLGNGAFDLGEVNSNNNHIAMLAADVGDVTGGAIGFRNAPGNALTIGSLGGTNGIQTDATVILTADRMTFSQNVDAGTGAVTLTTANAAETINLGSGTGGLELPDGVLDRIITSGTLTIGDGDHTGAIVVSGNVSP